MGFNVSLSFRFDEIPTTVYFIFLFWNKCALLCRNDSSGKHFYQIIVVFLLFSILLSLNRACSLFMLPLSTPSLMNTGTEWQCQQIKKCKPLFPVTLLLLKQEVYSCSPTAAHLINQMKHWMKHSNPIQLLVFVVSPAYWHLTRCRKDGPLSQQLLPIHLGILIWSWLNNCNQKDHCVL